MFYIHLLLKNETELFMGRMTYKNVIRYRFNIIKHANNDTFKCTLCASHTIATIPIE